MIWLRELQDETLLLFKKNEDRNANNKAYSDLSIQRFAMLDYAFLRYKNKKYFYFKKDGWSHFNCIHPVSSYSEKRIKDEDLQNAQVISDEGKTFFEIFNEIIVEKISGDNFVFRR